MINVTKRSLQVFLCHASNDKPIVKKLYERLINDGIDAWLDKEKLIPGQNWKIEIQKAVKNSDIVIVCLSSQSINKEGFIQKEIKFALDVADEKADGTIFIIPARLEDCDVPERISQFHWVDLFSDDGYEWLLKALRLRASIVGAVLEPTRRENISIKAESPQKTEEFLQQEQSINSSPKISSPSQTSSLTPSPSPIIGEWLLIIDWKASTDSDFPVHFVADGTLRHQDVFHGVWRQNGNSIHFEINNYSVFDGTIDGTKMTGKVSNKDGRSSTWKALFQH